MAGAPSGRYPQGNRGYTQKRAEAGRKRCWCIPPQANATFVHNMEDVLEVYRHPLDDRCPVVGVSGVRGCAACS